MAKKKTATKGQTTLLNKIFKAEKKIEQHEKQIAKDEKKLKLEEKKIEKEEKKVEQKERDLKEIQEDIIFSIRGHHFKKKHAFDLGKIAAGSLLGTGLGVGFISNNIKIAEQLGWGRIWLLTTLVLLFCALLIYKEEYRKISQLGDAKYRYIVGRVAMIYIISIILVSIVSVIMTPAIPEAMTLVKVMFIGSFSAASGAISFHLL